MEKDNHPLSFQGVNIGVDYAHGQDKTISQPINRRTNKMEPTQDSPQPAETVDVVPTAPQDVTNSPTEDLSLTEDDIAIATEEPAKAAPKDTSTETLDMDSMGDTWIPNPKVGEQTEVLTIKEIKKNTNIDAKRKDGQAFKTNLSNVDYKIDVHTDKGIFTPSCWEVWGKIKAAVRKNKELTKAEIVGTKFSVKHIVNGLYASKSIDEVRRLLELPNTPEGIVAAEAAKHESSEAQKLKKCYELTLYVSQGENQAPEQHKF